MARRKKQNEEEQENSDNINNESDDTFGLPEVEYEPLKRDEPKEEPQPEPVVEPVQEQPVYEKPYEVVEESVEEVTDHHDSYADDKASYTYEEEEPSQWPKILGIAVGVLFLAAGIYYFTAIYLPAKEAEKAREAAARLKREQLKNEADEKAALEARAREAEQRRLDSLNAIPKVGTLERLEGRTGRYYVVIASAIDVDLLTDYANQLVKKGSSVKIIPPFGKTKFHRLAVDVKDTYADAQTTADGLKGGDFGSEVWVVKY